MLCKVDYVALGRRISEERKKKHLTQAQLAEMADISPQFMGNLERGISKPSLHTVLSLGCALDISLDLLLRDSAVPSADAQDAEERYMLRASEPILCNTLTDWLFPFMLSDDICYTDESHAPVDLRDLPPLGFLALDEDFPEPPAFGLTKKGC